MGNNINWFQIAMILLVVGGGLLQWLGRQIAEQRAKRQAILERERAESERLRTGRVQTSSVSTRPGSNAAAELQAIAARRQQQLEELRRRQQAARRPTPTPAGTRPPTQRPLPGQRSTPTQQQPTRTPARPPSRGPVQTQVPTPPERVASGKTARSSYEPQDRADAARLAGQQAMRDRTASELLDVRDIESLSDQFARRDTAARKKSAQLPKAALDIGLPTTPAGWRRAILISEILAPPVSMREQA